jgi:haloalkane dehalogenase
MEVLRTPDSRFEALPDFSFAPNYLEVSDSEGGQLRMHFVDEGPRNAAPVLMLHGNPDWSYAFRSLISAVSEAGYRTIAPDMLGFGRSDKLVDRRAHSIDGHIEWLREFVAALDLHDITLVCQDWGGTIGLGVVAQEMDRFSRVIAANTILHTAEANLAGRLPSVFTVHATSETEVSIGTAMLDWIARSQRMPGLKASDSVLGMHANVAPDVAAAYDAPFPDESHLVAMRQFAMLIPLRPDDEGALRNRATWQALAGFEKPFVTLYGDSDPCTGGWDAIFQERVPGARGQPHTTLAGAGHFLAEDQPKEFAEFVLRFITETT